MSEYMDEYICEVNFTVPIGLRSKEPLVRCRGCAHSRIERHTGDDQRVCWVRRSHGEVVPDDGYCHRATPAEQ